MPFFTPLARLYNFVRRVQRPRCTAKFLPYPFGMSRRHPLRCVNIALCVGNALAHSVRFCLNLRWQQAATLRNNFFVLSKHLYPFACEHLTYYFLLITSYLKKRKSVKLFRLIKLYCFANGIKIIFQLLPLCLKRCPL